MLDNSKKKYFQDIAGLLLIIKGKISPSTDVNWTRYNTGEELISEMDSLIKSIEQQDFKALEKVHHHFLPTSTFQELSMSNGWGDQYIVLADKFDVLNEKINT